MKLIIAVLALFVSVTLYSMASAQTSQKVGLTLEGAKKVIAAAVAEAKNKNAPGGAIAVVDEGGNLVAVERLDNTFAAGANISIGKARTAALFKRPTKAFEETINKGRTAMTTLPDFTPLQGGFRSSSMAKSSGRWASAVPPARSKTKNSPSPAPMLWQ
jgi:uncharacterized protein GlcG (DUF336 family)